MKPPKHKRLLLAFLVMAALILTVQAATANVAINVGNDHRLLPDRAGQTIEIRVTGGDQVSGLNLFAQIGDGGPELTEFGLSPGTDGPAFEAVDLKTGTIFSSIAEEQSGDIAIPQVANYTISTTGSSVSANGLLVTLTIDTTGFHGGTWDLLLSNVLPDHPGGPFNTNFAPDWISITNGSFTMFRYGDCNFDDLVNSDDADIITANWLHDDGVGWAEGDFDNNGIVDDVDATIMAVNWHYSGDRTVPEPAAVVTLGIGVLFGFVMLYARRKFASRQDMR